MGVFMRKTNRTYLYIHAIMILPFLIYLTNYGLSNTKRFWGLFFLTSFGFYIVVTSGVIFWQGDRILLSLLPIWVFFYSLIINQLSIFFISYLQIN